MTAILGISAFYHDSAAALIVNGHLVAAAQEERFTRKKHDAGFPHHAIEFCLQRGGLAAEDLDYVAFYEKPFTKFARLLETYLAFAPAGYRSFRQAIPRWLKQKLYLPREIQRGLPGRLRGRLVFTEHHESHAASAFFPSPYEHAAILTLDGVGEWSTSCTGVGQDRKIELTHEIRFPHSLGLLYSAFTYYTGFRVNSGEYKLMGLAPYGRPVYREAILRHLIDLKEDGSFRLDMSYFNYCQGLTMTSSKFQRLFGGPPRQPETRLTQREMDLAASIQSVTEEVMLRMARRAAQLSGARKLVLAGGVALNCVGNGRILREGPFDEMWIQPAAGDAGGALGAALFVWHQLLEKPRCRDHTGTIRESQAGSLLGPEFSNAETKSVLDAHGARYQQYSSTEELCQVVARLIAQGNVVGWFQGRMEFGPRALGARSILGDARDPQMQSTMNQKIKFRESFRPFAPIVLGEKAHHYFQWKAGQESPYMLLVAPVRDHLRLPAGETQSDLCGIDRLQIARSLIPAVTHVDFSARVQTVDRVRNPRLHQLLTAFEIETGCPLMINTSLNVRGEPIVCSPRDAWRCFMMTDMDVLVAEDFVVQKCHQDQQASAAERADYLAEFTLD